VVSRLRGARNSEVVYELYVNSTTPTLNPIELSLGERTDENWGYRPTKLMYLVEAPSTITKVKIQEWYLYRTIDSPISVSADQRLPIVNKWFTGAINCVTNNTALTVSDVNCIEFYPQILEIEGAGQVKIYCAGVRD
jgi:hypothetical protein